MRRIFSAAIAAAVALALVSLPTLAATKKKAPRVAQPNARAMECLKQAGASYDPTLKRWMFYTTERDGASRTDMFRMCLAGGDRAKARAIAVPERQLNPASSVPGKF